MFNEDVRQPRAFVKDADIAKFERAAEAGQSAIRKALAEGVIIARQVVQQAEASQEAQAAKAADAVSAYIDAAGREIRRWDSAPRAQADGPFGLQATAPDSDSGQRSSLMLALRDRR